MASKSVWFWYILGALLLSLQGLMLATLDNRLYYISDSRLHYFGVLGLGWLSFAFALVERSAIAAALKSE